MFIEEWWIYKNIIMNENRNDLENLYLIFRKYNLIIRTIDADYDKGKYVDKEYIKRRSEFYFNHINENVHNLIDKNKKELKRIVTNFDNTKIWDNDDLTFEKALARNYIVALKNMETDKNLIKKYTPANPKDKMRIFLEIKNKENKTEIEEIYLALRDYNIKADELYLSYSKKYIDKKKFAKKRKENYLEHIDAIKLRNKYKKIVETIIWDSYNITFNQIFALSFLKASHNIKKDITLIEWDKQDDFFKGCIENV